MAETFSRTLFRGIAGSLFASIIPIWASPSPSYAVTGFTGAFEINPLTQNLWGFNNPDGSEGLITPEACDPELALTTSCIDNRFYQAGTISITAAASETGETKLIWPGLESNYNNTSGYYVSFFIDCPDCANSGLVTYSITGANGTFGTLNSINTSDPVSAYLAPGEIIEFSITNTSNYEGLKVDITNFNAVPAPLPAAGAATAFGYSRRLRRRIKGQRPKGSCPPVTPPHPSLYLNLAPVAVQALPVSFSYTSLPAAAVPHRPAA